MKSGLFHRPNKIYEGTRGAILILLIAGTSLFITRFTFESFELPKNAWISFWVTILLCITICGLLYRRPFRIMFTPLNGFLLGYVFLHLVSGFAADSTSLWWDEVKRVTMLFILALLLQDYLYGNRRRLLVLIWALAISAAITATWTILQDFASRFTPELLTTQSRLSDWRGFIPAGFGNSGYVADYLAVLFPMNLLLYLHARGKSREIFMLYTLCTSWAALVVCWSVQSNAGLILGFGFLVFFLIKHKPRLFWWRRRLRIVLVAAAFLFITLFYLSPLPINPHKPSIWKQAFSSGRWHYGGESRLVIWSQSLEIIRQHPWLGSGAGNFTYQYVQQASPFLISEPKRIHYIGMYSNAAHNELLQSWSELGVLGPAILFILIFLLLRSLLKNLDETRPMSRLIRIGAICAVLCAFIPAMMAYPLRLPTSSLLFFVICSLPTVLVPETRYFSDTIQVPVELNWHCTHVTVFLENFHKPVGGTLHFDLRPQPALLGTLFVILLFLPLCFQSIRPVISDASFKKGKTYVEAYQHGLVDDQEVREGEKHLLRALAWWPNHHDCRSTLGQYLSNRGRFRVAAYHLLITLKRLQAREIYKHLAICLEGLGKKEEAVKAYQVYFQRNPIMSVIQPELYHRFRILKESLEPSEPVNP